MFSVSFDTSSDPTSVFANFFTEKIMRFRNLCNPSCPAAPEKKPRCVPDFDTFETFGLVTSSYNR